MLMSFVSGVKTVTVCQCS